MEKLKTIEDWLYFCKREKAIKGDNPRISLKEFPLGGKQNLIK